MTVILRNLTNLQYLSCRSFISQHKTNQVETNHYLWLTLPLNLKTAFLRRKQFSQRNSHDPEKNCLKSKIRIPEPSRTRFSVSSGRVEDAFRIYVKVLAVDVAASLSRRDCASSTPSRCRITTARWRVVDGSVQIKKHVIN